MNFSDRAIESLTKCVNSQTGEILIDTFGRKDNLECTYQIVTDGEKVGWTPDETVIKERTINELIGAGLILETGSHKYQYTRDGFNLTRN